MSEHIHDCIVVGAGPAGSAAALQLARDGLDVVLLERGNRPGEKNVMSGVLLPGKLAALIPDFQKRAPLQRRITAGYERYYLSEDAVLRFPALRLYNLSDEEPGVPYTIYRSEFDAWFAGEAVCAGAELFTATLVEDLLYKAGQVVGVKTRRGDLHARVVIGADGVNSMVAEKSGLRERLMPPEASLIVREILDLPSDVIEERFSLEPGQGVLSLFTGLVHLFKVYLVKKRWMMSLKPSPMEPIPELTERIARSAFPRNDNVYMKMRDVFGTVYTDEQFADLYPQRGQPAESPWRLALVTVMQYAENLTDRQAADAVRGRIDWKYALGWSWTTRGSIFLSCASSGNDSSQGEQSSSCLNKC